MLCCCAIGRSQDTSIPTTPEAMSSYKYTDDVQHAGGDVSVLSVNQNEFLDWLRRWDCPRRLFHTPQLIVLDLDRSWFNPIQTGLFWTWEDWGVIMTRTSKIPFNQCYDAEIWFMTSPNNNEHIDWSRFFHGCRRRRWRVPPYYDVITPSQLQTTLSRPKINQFWYFFFTKLLLSV